jgi:hypothetical protein
MSTVTALTNTIEVDTFRGISLDDKKTLSEILTDLSGAADRIRRAGTKWVGLSEKTRDKVLENIPATWKGFFYRLQLVGEGRLHPHLYSATGAPARYLGRLPIDDQDKYIRELIPVAVLRGRTPDILRIDVEEMSKNQQQQVFKVSGEVVQIRSIPEQRAWMAEQERKAAKQEDSELGLTDINRAGRWRVSKGRVYIDPDKVASGLTRKDVALILRDLSI